MKRLLLGNLVSIQLMILSNKFQNYKFKTCNKFLFKSISSEKFITFLPKNGDLLSMELNILALSTFAKTIGR